jgi:hypothetical protein
MAPRGVAGIVRSWGDRRTENVRREEEQFLSRAEHPPQSPLGKGGGLRVRLSFTVGDLKAIACWVNFHSAEGALR